MQRGETCCVVVLADALLRRSVNVHGLLDGYVTLGQKHDAYV